MPVFSAIMSAILLSASEPVPLAASVLPPARHAEVGGDPVTFFATIANAGADPAENCRIEMEIPGATFDYRAYDVGGSSFVAEANTPVGIPANSAQVFVLGVTFSTPLVRTEIEPRYVCNNGEALRVHGVTDLSVAASTISEPDVLVLASTSFAPGINRGRGNSVFAVAIANLNGIEGVDVPVEIGADLLDRRYHVRLEICEIDEQAQCISPRQNSIQTTLSGRENRTFAVWVGGHFSYTPPYYDIVRIRTLVRETESREIVGSTSVAHDGFVFREACVGDLAASPWSGTIQHQSALQDDTGFTFTNLIFDLNFYSDGLGNIYAVPIDGTGTRFSGSITNPIPDGYSSCFDVRGGSFTLNAISDGPDAPHHSIGFNGPLRRTRGAIYGRDASRDGGLVISSSFRAFYTHTDVRVFPISFQPVNDPVTTPPLGIGGVYEATILAEAGPQPMGDVWTVADDAVAGRLSYRLGSGEEAVDIMCDMALSHSGVIIPSSLSDQPPNPHYRVLDGSFANCSGGSSATALEGNYHGLMIYQPLTSIGEPLENGLEVVLSRVDGEDDYLLWFVLRTPEP